MRIWTRRQYEKISEMAKVGTTESKKKNNHSRWVYDGAQTSIGGTRSNVETFAK